MQHDGLSAAWTCHPRARKSHAASMVTGDASVVAEEHHGQHHQVQQSKIHTQKLKTWYRKPWTWWREVSLKTSMQPFIMISSYVYWDDFGIDYIIILPPAVSRLKSSTPRILIVIWPWTCYNFVPYKPKKTNQWTQLELILHILKN